MSERKERLDVLLVEQGFFESREKAKAAVMAGLVLVNGERMEKAGMKVPATGAIIVKGDVHPYVSRGGLKLERAIREFGLDLSGAVMIDIGSSTGGFTDCALQHGAAFVYAIDVGTNQLHWSLRTDSRVKVMEKFNFRFVTPEHLTGPAPTFAATDVSFISLQLILPPLKPLLQPGSRVVALVKPQFEAGRESVGKGIVRDPKVHRDVLQTVTAFAERSGFELQGLTHSPITGGEGNIEFLALWSVAETQGVEPGANRKAEISDLIDRVVDQAHDTFLRPDGQRAAGNPTSSLE
ncbi:TlyA family RNA methyltransferase [Paenibacillus thermotolerans]|uniref:TlyA family RNA methyltransferase n=1 Tax=Paenibacillus thermotolerans TaxID=3027807 RepID=UPI002368CABF|nr:MULTISPECIES: TlyA family RNA methyltransferase [unclassified Paenibacillus]